LLTTWEH